MEIDSVMPRINEATGTDLKVIDPVRKFFSNGVERLMQIGRKRGDILLYQQEYALRSEHQKIFDGKKSIKPDITLTDMNGNILAVF